MLVVTRRRGYRARVALQANRGRCEPGKVAPRPLTPDDLGKIEAKMHEVVKQDAPFEHRDITVPEALKLFGERKQDYKVDQIKKLAEKGVDEDSDDEVENGTVSVYQHNGFVD